MLKNYIVIAFRNLFKFKTFSAINIFGLAISMSVCLLIIALVRDQQSYDTFHKNADRIYRVTSELENPYGRSHQATSPGPLAPALRSSSPDIENTLRLRQYAGQVSIPNQDNSFGLMGLYAEPSFFEFFDFELVQGNANTALSSPYQIILTSKAATRLFGDADPLGQILEQGDQIYTVTGVLKELPTNTHVKIESLVSFSTIEANQKLGEKIDLYNWNSTSFYYTYLLLDKEANPAGVEALATSLAAQNYTSTQTDPPVLQLQPLTDINLGENLSNQISNILPKEVVYGLSVLAFILIFTAIFNFISLSVARSLKRAKEIGVRKVVGAHRGQIIQQFLSESVILTMLALLAAILFLSWLVPAFNNLSVVKQDLGITLTINYLRDFKLYSLFIGFALIVGVLSGFYPSLIMSRYIPTKVLKGNTSVKGFRGFTLRKTLTVAQFTFSIIGIITTLVMYQQFTELFETNYGFDQQELVNVELQEQSYDLLKAEMMRQPGVVQVAGVSIPPVVGGNSRTTIQTDAMNEPSLIRFHSVDEAFLEQFRVKLVAGRNFSKEMVDENGKTLLINEKAVQMLKLKTPEKAVGTTITFADSAATIVGVVEDFYASALQESNQATVLVNRPEDFRVAVVRFRPENVVESLAAIKGVWADIAPTREFQYSFFEDQLVQRFRPIRDMVSVIGFIVGFVIFIACLGLLGMSVYTTETRIQEIGIRKVMGAKVSNIVFLLSRDYITMVIIAAALATPIAWLLSNSILQDFVNRINLSPVYFVIGIAGTIALALLTVGSQTVKAGYMNPVDTLKQE